MGIGIFYWEGLSFFYYNLKYTETLKNTLIDKKKCWTFMGSFPKTWSLYWYAFFLCLIAFAFLNNLLRCRPRLLKTRLSWPRAAPRAWDSWCKAGWRVELQQDRETRCRRRSLIRTQLCPQFPKERVSRISINPNPLLFQHHNIWSSSRFCIQNVTSQKSIALPTRTKWF